MNLQKIVIIIFLLYNSVSIGEIRMVLGAALTDNYYEFRKKQYLESFRILSNLGINDFYIIEAVKKKGPTFLEDYCKNVFYASTNNPHYRNNGINESKTLLEGLYYFNFDPEDIIIKLTGRYHLLSDYFINIVKENPTYDAFVKKDDHGQIHTACFAMRNKYLIEMYQTIDYGSMERHMINIEHEANKYISNKIKTGSLKVLFVDKLDVVANQYGSASVPNAPEKIVFY